MQPTTGGERHARFGIFEIDLRSGRVQSNGHHIKLQEKPLQILTLLMERPGELVTREEIRKRLWPEDTFVDFEHSINTAVKKLREALGDDADHPRFIETVPRHGYRLITPVKSESPPLKSPRLAAFTAVLVVAAGFLVALNVAGLRERALTFVGASRPVGTPPPKIESIAVLPLENLSHDPQQEYFADGMTEALITDLGKIRALRVISRQSVIHYKGSKKPLPEIARELNVDAVLEGTVLVSGDRVRITANLIQAVGEKHLWAESYEREASDVLTLQGEVALATARAVEARVTPQEQARLARPRPVEPEAVGTYFNGVYLWRRGQPESVAAAIRNLQRAVEVQPDFAMAYVRLADAYNRADSLDLSRAKRRELHRKSTAAVRKALALDDTLAEAHSLLGANLLAWEWNWEGSQQELKRALELDHGDPLAHYRYASWLEVMGRYDEAIAEIRRAIELDPLELDFRRNLGITYGLARRYDEAIREFQDALRLDPTDALCHGGLFEVYAYKGMYEAAIAEVEKWRKLRNPPPLPGMYEANLVWIEALAGNKEKARTMLRKKWALIAKLPPTHTPLAGIYAMMGYKAEALRFFEEAQEDRDLLAPMLLRGSADLDSLRSDPRFQALLRRMNFPQ